MRPRTPSQEPLVWRRFGWPATLVILTTLIVRLRCVRLGIVMHALTNNFGILATFLAVVS